MLNAIRFIRLIAAAPLLLVAVLLTIVAAVFGKAAKTVLGDNGSEKALELIGRAFDDD